MSPHILTRAHRPLFRSMLLEQLEGRVVPSFLTARAYDVWRDTNAGTVGDFNIDGHPDPAASHSSGRVGVLLGNGDGSFRNALIQGPLANITPAFAVGEFNGDGRPDLVRGIVGIPPPPTPLAS